MGLSMGALILGGLGAWYLQHGNAFEWPRETLKDQLSLAKIGVFLVLWVSSFHLEIWSLEPIRKAQRKGGEGCCPRGLYRRVTTQLGFHAVLLVLVAGLALAGSQA